MSTWGLYRAHKDMVAYCYRTYVTSKYLALFLDVRLVKTIYLGRGDSEDCIYDIGWV